MPTVPFTRPPWRSAGLLLACAALALPLAACGSSGGSGSGAAAAAAADDARETAQLKLQECMRDQGVEGPGAREGEGGDGPPSEAEMERVRDALDGPCRDEAQDAFGSIGEEDREAMEDARVKMTACLEEHGVEMPSPNDERPALLRIDPEDEELRAAMEACRDELPAELRDGPRRGGMVFGGPRP